MLKKLKPFFLVLLFMLLIWLPLLRQVFDFTAASENTEKRQLAALPDMNWQLQTLLSYPKSFEDYYNDNFGLRSSLVRWYQRFKIFIFGVSPSKRVIIGKQGWLFFTDENVIEDYRNTRLFSQAELEQWRQSLESKWNWLTKQGIRYVFVIAPNKHTIYQEFLPYYVNQIGKLSRTDQLVAYLHIHSQVPVIDLRPALRAAKQQNRTYHKTDTHWNNFGGYSAYTDIFKHLSRLFPDDQFGKAKQYQFKSENASGGDLANMLGASSILREFHINPVLSLEKCAERRTIPPGDIAWLKGTEPYATYCKQAKQRALMIGDSYSIALAPYLSEHFQNIAYVRTRAWEAKTVKILTHFVEQEKPQLVIDERLERVLQYLPDKYEETSLEHKHMETEATFNLKEGVLSLHIVKFSATEFYRLTMKFDEIAQQFKMTAMVPIASKDKVLATFSVATGVLDIPLVKVTVAPKQTLFYEAKLKRLESGSEWRFIIENIKEKK